MKRTHLIVNTTYLLAIALFFNALTDHFPHILHSFGHVMDLVVGAATAIGLLLLKYGLIKWTTWNEELGQLGYELVIFLANAATCASIAGMWLIDLTHMTFRLLCVLVIVIDALTFTYLLVGRGVQRSLLAKIERGVQIAAILNIIIVLMLGR